MSSNHHIQNISDAIKIDIMNNHVEPAYKKDIIDLLQGKRCWRITGQTFETISKIFVAIGSIVSFASGIYNKTYLSFIAGTISTISLATLQFASFGFTENKKQASELNTLLNNINIKSMPIITRNIETNFRQTNEYKNNMDLNIQNGIHTAIIRDYNGLSNKENDTQD